MIAVVTYDEYDTKFVNGEAMEAISDSAILTINEDINAALDKIKEHQSQDPEADIQYDIQFWNDGEVVCAAQINEDMDVCREKVINHYKSYLH